MEPAFHSGQFLIVDKHSKDYVCGDVVAIQKNNIPGYIVKRIVAIPGDSVYIKNWELYINEVKSEIQEPVIFAGIAANPVVLGENEYFVLGDNLNNSTDSRHAEIGLIDLSEIKGEVLN